jgi:hypothetical protein
VLHINGSCIRVQVHWVREANWEATEGNRAPHQGIKGETVQRQEIFCLHFFSSSSFFWLEKTCLERIFNWFPFEEYRYLLRSRKEPELLVGAGAGMRGSGSGSDSNIIVNKNTKNLHYQANDLNRSSFPKNHENSTFFQLKAMSTDTNKLKSEPELLKVRTWARAETNIFFGSATLLLNKQNSFVFVNDSLEYSCIFCTSPAPQRRTYCIVPSSVATHQCPSWAVGSLHRNQFLRCIHHCRASSPGESRLLGGEYTWVILYLRMQIVPRMLEQNLKAFLVMYYWGLEKLIDEKTRV